MYNVILNCVFFPGTRIIQFVFSKAYFSIDAIMAMRENHVHTFKEHCYSAHTKRREKDTTT